MNRTVLIVTLSLAAATGCLPDSGDGREKGTSGHAVGGNPAIREGSADPSVRVFNGRVYIYPSHDYSRDNEFWIMKDWKVYSTTDLVNFTDHGTALKGKDVSWAKDPTHCWAPDCAEKNGTWYFYFPISDVQGVWKGEIGVGTGHSPAGPFSEALGAPLIGSDDKPADYKGSFYNIDPAVFTDEDGRSYLFWGNGACFTAELNDDMISLKSGIRLVSIENHRGYREGPFVWKRNGTYYMLFSRVGSSSWDSLDYAIAESVMGPYRFGGALVGHGRKGNIHGSVFEYKGQWYVAYHDLFPTDKYRMTCLERIHYREDGSIARTAATRSGVGWYYAGERIEAENYFDKDPGTSYSGLPGPGFYMAGMKDGQWISFPNTALPFDFSGHLRIRLSHRGEAGSIRLYIDSPEGDPVARIQVSEAPEATGWKEFETETGPLDGIHDLTLFVRGGESTRFDLDWFRLY